MEFSDVRLVLLSNKYYDFPLGWRLSKRTASIVGAQSGRYWDCEPNARFDQTLSMLSNADCVQALVSHDLTETLDEAAKRAAIANFGAFGFPDSIPEGKRVDGAALMRCYRDRTAVRLNLAQFRSVQAVLQFWDDHAEYQDDRWLAYLLGTIYYETGGLRTKEQRGSGEYLERVNRMPRCNEQPEDPVMFRGRGSIQLTGRCNYRSLKSEAGADIESYPDLMFNPEIDAQVSSTFLLNGLRSPAMRQAMDSDPRDWKALRTIVTGRRPAQPGAVAIGDAALKFEKCIAASKPWGA